VPSIRPSGLASPGTRRPSEPSRDRCSERPESAGQSAGAQSYAQTVETVWVVRIVVGRPEQARWRATPRICPSGARPSAVALCHFHFSSGRNSVTPPNSSAALDGPALRWIWRHSPTTMGRAPRGRSHPSPRSLMSRSIEQKTRSSILSPVAIDTVGLVRRRAWRRGRDRAQPCRCQRPGAGHRPTARRSPQRSTIRRAAGKQPFDSPSQKERHRTIERGARRLPEEQR